MIPGLLHHVWVGEKKPPLHWMSTWPRHHPAWEYRHWGNEEVFDRQWRNQRLVDAYRAQSEWRGVADVVRYEILHEMGGLMPGCDSECLRPVDELLSSGIEACAVYESEEARPGLITPLYAAMPGAAFADAMIRACGNASAGEPWRCVGNLLMQSVYEAGDWPAAQIHVWPSHYFNPEHYSGVKYRGDCLPYARQHWGSTKGLY